MDVIVVGAGLSGLMAASCAAARGLDVVVLEKQSLSGGKLCYSGMGAAPVTNTDLDISHFHGREARFVSDALKAFPAEALRDWFATAEVSLEDAKYYGMVHPAGGGEVIEALGGTLENWHVNQRVTAVSSNAGGFSVSIENEAPIQSRAVVLATGGSNLPQLGGGVDGYRVAESLGHTIAPGMPALVGLAIEDEWALGLTGVWMDVTLDVQDGKRTLASSTGSMLFTASGLTGQAVFNVSHVVEPALAGGAELELSINFHPNMTPADVEQWLFRVFGERSREPVDRTIDHLLPARLGQALLRRQRVKPGARVMQMNEQQRSGLLSDMLDTRLKLSGTLGLRAAEGVTGGVNVREINPRTFESKKTPGLYVTGQLLDVHGDWGGFEQHFSLASGWVAGHSVLKRLIELCQPNI